MSELTLTKGDDRTIFATITDETDAIVNLTGALEVTFSIRLTKTGTALLTRTLGSGVTIPTPTNGVIEVVLTAVQTATFDGLYFFDIVLLDAASITTTVNAGTILIQPAGEGLLTVDELRRHVTTSLSDAALKQLLDAAGEAILAYAGDPDTAVEIIDGGHPRLALKRRAISVIAISETPWNSTTSVALSADDYRIRAEGYVLERLNTGTNPRSSWHGVVTVTYALASTDALRRLVQIDLVKLDISLNSNLSSHTIGDFSETFDNSKSPEAKRDEILSRLTGEPGLVVVGG